GTRIRRASQIDWSRRPRRAPRARAPKSYRSKKMSKVRLTSNQYGKAENRLMRVYPDSQRHEIRDVNVTSQLWVDIETAHTEGNNHTIFTSAPEVRTAVLMLDGAKDTLISGFNRLTDLKTTESGSGGYRKNKYTTPPDTDDRIHATDIATRWIYDSMELDFE